MQSSIHEPVAFSSRSQIFPRDCWVHFNETCCSFASAVKVDTRFNVTAVVGGGVRGVWQFRLSKHVKNSPINSLITRPKRTTLRQKDRNRIFLVEMWLCWLVIISCEIYTFYRKNSLHVTKPSYPVKVEIAWRKLANLFFKKKKICVKVRSQTENFGKGTWNRIKSWEITAKDDPPWWGSDAKAREERVEMVMCKNAWHGMTKRLTLRECCLDWRGMWSESLFFSMPQVITGL